MSDNFMSFVVYFRYKLAGERLITRSIIEALITDDVISTAISDFDRKRLVRHLEASFEIQQEEGPIIMGDHMPWLSARKSGIDFFYWNRLKNYLINEDILPPDVISKLDTDTDSILDCCGNPNADNPWKYRGMVIGHVQSGKTTNYSALITKAADAGYKVIILMAGITNSLRSQTQQRIDEYFIGRRSVFNAAAQEPMRLRNYGEGRYKDPDFGTTRDQDFSRDRAGIGAAFSALNEPKIFVIKKNKSVLENLNIWITDQAHGAKVKYPLLLIDDEADNASINTHKDPNRSTTINRLIRELASQFSQSSYVGYTATPFANIFIEPDSQQEMAEEDLFPKDFIKALNPPTNYCGAHKIFSEDGKLRESTVREIDDYADILPLKHKKDHQFESLPPSLEGAIRVFILARTIRFLRGQGTKHCTMMINVSRFNDVQDRVEGFVYVYLDRLKNAIAIHAKSDTPMIDSDIRTLEQTYQEEFSALEFEFTDILKSINQASSTIGAMTVNMRGGTLDYEQQKTSGLHIITIGGLALSRGLTLEGLVTTYLLRNVGASDTLMQMARWFGYRPDYEDLCRIFLPEDAIEHYRQTSIAIEELRAEVGHMEQSGLTPYDFGLKVRHSPTGIKITAANKMRSASVLQIAADYAARYIQGHAIFNDNEISKKNRAHVSEFLAKCGDPLRDFNKARYYWNNASGRDVLRLLRLLEFPEKVMPLTHISGDSSLLGDYIADRVSGELATWEVAIQSPLKLNPKFTAVTDFVSGEELFPSERAKADIVGHIYRFTGSKNAVGDNDTPKIGLSKTKIEEAEEISKGQGDKYNKFCRIRSKPLMIISLIGIGEEGKVEGCRLENYCVSVSFCLPETQQQVREQTYSVNEVFRRSMNDPLQDETDDDEVDIFGD